MIVVRQRKYATSDQRWMRVARAWSRAPMLLLAACPSGKAVTPTPSPTAGGGRLFRVGSVDALSDELAQRTQQRFGQADDFQVIVTQAAYGIGTLMRPGRTIPIDYTACAPQTTPPLVPAPSLFPSYSLSRETAARFGLDDAVLKGIAEAGGDIGRVDAVKLEFANSAISTLSDRDIKRLIAVPACAELLADGPVLLVRGYVFGQRTFRFDRTRTNDAKLKVSKIASFDVKLGDGATGVAISDSGPVGFLQIVSALAVERKPTVTATSGESRSLPTGVASVVVGQPAILNRAGSLLAQRMGRVYVQRDVADTSGTDDKVLAALKAADLPVVGKVEPIPSAKVPTRAQVRYFNAGDGAVANTALAKLRTFYPNAVVTRIPLPSPPGQLEIWLPKVNVTLGQSVAVRRDPAAASVLLSR